MERGLMSKNRILEVHNALNIDVGSQSKNHKIHHFNMNITQSLN